ncbi:MAG: hypothetical protein WD690_10060 [Vicinamibacterales bacterium]
MAAFEPSAQSRPDFSGRWTMDAPAPSPAPPVQPPAQGRRGGGPAVRSGDLGSGWGSTITIAQTERALTVEYAFFTRGDMQPPLKFTFALDGSESKNTVMMGRGFQVERSKPAWEGQTLVITTLHDFKDPASGKPVAFEVTRRLSLESPDSLMVETTRGGVLGGPPSTTRVVYRRAAGG